MLHHATKKSGGTNVTTVQVPRSGRCGDHDEALCCEIGDTSDSTSESRLMTTGDTRHRGLVTAAVLLVTVLFNMCSLCILRPTRSAKGVLHQPVASVLVVLFLTVTTTGIPVGTGDQAAGDEEAFWEHSIVILREINEEVDEAATTTTITTTTTTTTTTRRPDTSSGSTTNPGGNLPADTNQDANKQTSGNNQRVRNADPDAEPEAEPEPDLVLDASRGVLKNNSTVKAKKQKTQSNLNENTNAKNNRRDKKLNPNTNRNRNRNRVTNPKQNRNQNRNRNRLQLEERKRTQSPKTNQNQNQNPQQPSVSEHELHQVMSTVFGKLATDFQLFNHRVNFSWPDILIQEIFRYFDLNGDQMIALEEFAALLPLHINRPAQALAPVQADAQQTQAAAPVQAQAKSKSKARGFDNRR